jgi:hypothetical protein
MIHTKGYPDQGSLWASSFLPNVKVLVKFNRIPILIDCILISCWKIASVWRKRTSYTFTHPSSFWCTDGGTSWSSQVSSFRKEHHLEICSGRMLLMRNVKTLGFHIVFFFWKSGESSGLSLMVN